MTGHRRWSLAPGVWRGGYGTQCASRALYFRRSERTFADVV